jgi:hypothetical protein
MLPVFPLGLALLLLLNWTHLAALAGRSTGGSRAEYAPPPYDPNGRVSCEGQITPGWDFSQAAALASPPPMDEVTNDPPGRALARLLANPSFRPVVAGRRDQWKVLSRTSDQVLYGPGAGVDAVAVVFRNGPSGWTGGGGADGCRLRHPGAATFRYSVSVSDPAALNITWSGGRCGRGPDQKLQQLSVRETTDQVMIAAIAASAEIPAGDTVCGGLGAAFNTTAHLRVPLRGRIVMDAGAFPPEPASQMPGS